MRAMLALWLLHWGPKGESGEGMAMMASADRFLTAEGPSQRLLTASQTSATSPHRKSDFVFYITFSSWDKPSSGKLNKSGVRALPCLGTIEPAHTITFSSQTEHVSRWTGGDHAK